ncbi:MAG: hypothetical protein ACHQRM_03285 [Bacteroidia bacterium]
MKSHGNVRLLLVTLISFSQYTIAQIPKMKEIPDYLSASVKTTLANQKAELLGKKAALKSKMDHFNSACDKVVTGSAAEKECQAEQAGINSDKTALRAGINAFNESISKENDRKVESLDKVILEEEKNIKKMNFNKRAEEFEEWEKLSEESRKEFELKCLKLAYETVIDLSIEKIKKDIATVPMIENEQADEMIRMLKEKGIKDGKLFDAIRSMTKVKNGQKVFDALGGLVKATNVEPKSKEQESETQQALGGYKKVLEGLLHDPALKFLVTESDFTISAVYNSTAQHISNYRISKLTSLTESELRDLQKMTKNLENHVKERNEAKRNAN